MASTSDVLLSLSVLEPIAGAGLALSLAYLALERFRYRRDVELVAVGLHKKYENDATFGDNQTLEQLLELKWLCRKDCNGHSPSGFTAGVYKIFFRKHGDVWIVAFLSACSALVLVQGVAGEAGVWPKNQFELVKTVSFITCSLAMIIPGVAVLAGRACKDWGIRRSRKCDDQIAQMLQISAREAKVPKVDDPTPEA